MREWLNAQAAGGYVDYHRTGATASRPSRPSRSPTRTARPTCPGFFEIALGSVLDSPRITDAARSGAGVGWHEHNHHVHDGCERFFRPGYDANLVDSWLPALDGVVEKLERGARVADVGCGHGASTILMAERVPATRRSPAPTTTRSRSRPRAARAARPGVADRVRFEVAPAAAYTGEGYDLVTMFDCLHDMGDPVGAAAPRPAHARPGRHVDDRRARRRRPRRGQPQPGRPRLLRLLDAAVHARVALPGRRPGARRPGRPGADRGGRHRAPASPASAASPRPRSTSCSRRRPCKTSLHERRRSARARRGRANGINVIAESRAQGRPARPVLAVVRRQRLASSGVAYGAFVLGFGISFWQARDRRRGRHRRRRSRSAGWSRSPASAARRRPW